MLIESPFDFDDYVRPACLPPLDWTSKFSGGIMVASGMGEIENDKSTSELKLASIHMLSKNKCKNLDFPGSLFKGESKLSSPNDNFRILRFALKTKNLYTLKTL